MHHKRQQKKLSGRTEMLTQGTTPKMANRSHMHRKFTKWQKLTRAKTTNGRMARKRAKQETVAVWPENVQSQETSGRMARSTCKRLLHRDEVTQSKCERQRAALDSREAKTGNTQSHKRSKVTKMTISQDGWSSNGLLLHGRPIATW